MWGPIDIITKSGAFSNGFTVPLLGYGTYRIAPKDAYESVLNALRTGYRHFDCAKAYANEAAVGRALRDGMKELKLKREQLFITSKLWNTDHHPDRVLAACETTVERLGVGYLDLYLMHWPVAWKAQPRVLAAGSGASHAPTADPDADAIPEDLHPVDSCGQNIVDTSIGLADTWAALEDLTTRPSKVRAHGHGRNETMYAHSLYTPIMSQPIDRVAGDPSVTADGKPAFEPLVRSLGLSNFGEADIRAVIDSGRCNVAPVCNQIELHPGLPQTRLKSVHAMNRLVTVAYCPLGMPTRFTPPEFTGVARDPFFEFFRERTGFSPARLLLNWSADLGHVLLVKAQSLKHMQENAKTQRFALMEAQRSIFDNYHTLRPIRVVNPTAFRGDGKPFFADPPAPAARKEMIDAYERTVREVGVRQEAERVAAEKKAAKLKATVPPAK